MPKKTLQERFVQALTARGWSPDPLARSRKYVTLAKAGELHKLFIGKAGSLRRGDAFTRSIPVSASIRDKLLSEVPE